MSLKGKVCLVTGATRGIGKGIAVQLGQAGATVYITGRTLKKENDTSGVGGCLEDTAAEVEARGGKCIPVLCDHSKDSDIEKLFEKIKSDYGGQLDLLVNNAYSGAQAIMKSMGKKFWEIEPTVWDSINNVGLRNHYICSVYASRLMTARKSGLIVNVSSAGALFKLFNVAYGVGKAAFDRLSADCAVDLKGHNVACVSLWPGAAETEMIAHFLPQADDSIKKTFSNMESTEFSGVAIVNLMQDAKIMQKSGRILLTSELAEEYGYSDVNGKTVNSIRQLNSIIIRLGYTGIAAFIPSFVRIPYWLLALAGNKF